MDQVDFMNTMRTIGWSSGAANGYEEIAYGAALSLMHYRDHLTQPGRMAWAQANNRLSDAGRQGIQRTRQGYFLSVVNQLRLQTYGINFDDTAIAHQPMLVTTPWAQTDAEFQFSMNYINTGQMPDESRFVPQVLSKDGQIVAQKVTDTLKKEALKYLEKGAVAVGGAAVATFFKVKNTTLAGLVTDIAWELIKSRLNELQKKDVVARFRIDEERRKHLANIGQSTYRPTS